MAIRKLMDLKTSEVIELDIQTHAGKLRDQQWAMKMQSKKEHEKLTGSFTFTLLSTVRELIADERFNDDEKTRLMFLGTYVSYEGESYSRLQKGNGSVIIKKHLKKLLMITNNKSFYTFYNKLLRHKIILEVQGRKGDIELYWSCKYHFKGKTTSADKKSKNLIKLYDKQLRELYLAKDHKGKQKYRPSNLYVLFAFLPMINYETNLLSNDADKPASQTRPLVLKEVAERLDISRPYILKRRLLKIKLNNAPVFSIITEADKEYIRVNPFIVWRNTSDPSPAITETFKSTEDYLKSQIYEGNTHQLKMDVLIKKMEVIATAQ